ncbi:hypothetical protein E2C01_077835 [Portunus trituberculatus]|uniref:Uncharacterized protein n=1 Tax=Portunus trituberculatus TaxID=210409 RepID=A0A5B7IFH2_PORTR|nr:hypothetical protein [Portunus trituberculatus]
MALFSDLLSDILTGTAAAMARPGAHRKFYDFSGQGGQDGEVPGGAEKNTRPEELVKYVAKNIIGADAVFSSPFGPRKGELIMPGNQNNV